MQTFCITKHRLISKVFRLTDSDQVIFYGNNCTPLLLKVKTLSEKVSVGLFEYKSERKVFPKMTFNVSSLTEVEFLNHFPVFASLQTSACHEWSQNLNSEVPKSWDWRDSKIVSKIQNQGAMGSSAIRFDM